jgi:hypothetical protein
MNTVRLTLHNPKIWRATAILLFIAMFVARCDDFSTYPKG